MFVVVSRDGQVLVGAGRGQQLPRSGTVSVAGARYRTFNTGIGRAPYRLQALVPEHYLKQAIARERTKLLIIIGLMVFVALSLALVLGGSMFASFGDLLRKAETADSDELTSLPNRRAFKEALAKEIQRSTVCLWRQPAPSSACRVRPTSSRVSATRSSRCCYRTRTWRGGRARREAAGGIARDQPACHRRGHADQRELRCRRARPRLRRRGWREPDRRCGCRVVQRKVAGAGTRCSPNGFPSTARSRSGASEGAAISPIVRPLS